MDRIYLANNIFSGSAHHAVGAIRNETGELLDEQTTYVAVELDKRKMTPDERFAYQRTLAINAEAIRVVNAQLEKIQNETIRKALKRGRLSVDGIAEDS